MAKRYCILSYKVLILAIICCFINANAQAAPILKLNSHGHDVIVLQQNLIRMNYDLSKVSGNYDKETQVAAKAFQKDHKIKVTGIVNRETWWAIKGGKQNVIVNSQSSINEKIILDNLSWITDRGRYNSLNGKYSGDIDSDYISILIILFRIRLFLVGI